jgi:hypothetical protein
MKILIGNLQQIHLVVVEEVVMATMDRIREAETVEAVETAETKEVEEEDRPPATAPMKRIDQVALEDLHTANGNPGIQRCRRDFKLMGKTQNS